jgi:hypothetical protein
VSLALSSRRAALMPGQWVRNALWRSAKAVPSLDLRFAESKSLVDATTGQSLVTFTRASSGTYVGSDGLIKTATTNEPRFDHNPTTGESLGLLVEEQRTNLLLRSEEFGNASWSKVSTTITANSIAAPDGLITADTITDSNDVAAAAHSATSPSQSFTSGVAYTVSVFAKAGTLGETAFIFPSSAFTATLSARFSLTAGTVTAVDAGVTGSIVSLPNGWYRCTATATATTTASGTIQFRTATTTGSFYQGNGTGTIYLWGAQLEAGAFPTSYIPTTTATVTRSADVASITGTNFSSWYRQDAQTWYGEYAPGYTASATAPPNTPHLFQVYANSSSTNNYAVRAATNTVNQEYVARNPTVGNQFVQNAGIGYGVAGVNRKISYGIDSSTLNVSTNGSAISSLTNNVAALMAAHDTLALGSGTGGSPPYTINGTIRRLTYWPTRLSNSTLQAITQ